MNSSCTWHKPFGLATDFLYDSLTLAAMIEYGIGSLATRDGDLDHIPTIIAYKPTDV